MFDRLPEISRSSLPEIQEGRVANSTNADVRLHSSGFLVVTDGSESVAEPHIASDIVLFHGNSLSFSEPSTKHRKEYQSNLNKGITLLRSIGLDVTKGVGCSPLRRHSDTVFFPILLQHQKYLYISPWTSEGVVLSTNAPPKIKEFVMTNCLFGSAILGIDDQGNKYPLIDHNLQVNDIITQIQLNDTIHPYEALSFSAIQGLLPLLKCIGADNFVIRYHLPVVDYMLYGVHLYISGKIAFDALEDFIEKINERGEKHKKIIRALAEKNNVNICVESPFDNLFSEDIELSASKLLEQLSLSVTQIERMKKDNPKFSRALSRTAKRGGHKAEDFKSIIDILNALDEFGSEGVYSVSDGVGMKPPRELFEELCIENILDHLKTNNRYPEYQQVWQDIICGGEIDRFSPLKQLFKVANIAFVARSRRGHTNDFDVCSFLPADEKPIAQAYNELLASKFGNILCLSWFPPILNYVEHQELVSVKHYKNNLFRLRTDLIEIDHDAIKKYLTDYFELPSDFWTIVDNAFSGLVVDNSSVIDSEPELTFFSMFYQQKNVLDATTTALVNET